MLFEEGPFLAAVTGICLMDHENRCNVAAYLLVVILLAILLFRTNQQRIIEPAAYKVERTSNVRSVNKLNSSTKYIREVEQPEFKVRSDKSAASSAPRRASRAA